MFCSSQARPRVGSVDTKRGFWPSVEVMLSNRVSYNGFERADTKTYLSDAIKHPAQTLAASSTCSGNTRNLTRLKSCNISGLWRPKCMQAVFAMEMSMKDGFEMVEGDEYGQTHSNTTACMVR